MGRFNGTKRIRGTPTLAMLMQPHDVSHAYCAGVQAKRRGLERAAPGSGRREREARSQHGPTALPWPDPISSLRPRVSAAREASRFLRPPDANDHLRLEPSIPASIDQVSE
jgi:hypothetical protein